MGCCLLAKYHDLNSLKVSQLTKKYLLRGYSKMAQTVCSSKPATKKSPEKKYRNPGCLYGNV